jgi:hypothetical protein
MRASKYFIMQIINILGSSVNSDTMSTQIINILRNNCIINTNSETHASPQS